MEPTNEETNVQVRTVSSLDSDVIKNKENEIADFTIQVGKAEVTKERLLALIRLILMAGTVVASMLGYAFDADAIYNIILTLLMAASLIYGYWKNNNWTVAAVEAQSFLDAEKEELKEQSETEED